MKEACLTLAAVAQELGHRAEEGLEPLLPSLLGLLHSSATDLGSLGGGGAPKVKSGGSRGQSPPAEMWVCV